MRPDLSLGIGHSADASAVERSWLHFDAKYRVEGFLQVLEGERPDDAAGDNDTSHKHNRALREDLSKMHAYRDAIRGSSGAYVVYPGDSHTEGDEIFLKYHELLPGLGAFALRPTEDGPATGESAIRSFINDALNHFADVLSQDRRAGHWERTVMGHATLHRNPKPVRSNAISGLWFLKRPPADEPILLVSNDAWTCLGLTTATPFLPGRRHADSSRSGCFDRLGF